jgi:hypothetical protein
VKVTGSGRGATIISTVADCAPLSTEIVSWYMVPAARSPALNVTVVFPGNDVTVLLLKLTSLAELRVTEDGGVPCVFTVSGTVDDPYAGTVIFVGTEIWKLLGTVAWTT